MSTDLTDTLKRLKTEFPYATTVSLKAIPKKTKLADSSLLEELGKLSQLIKSNATKLGIISTPDRILSNEDAFKKQLVDLMNVLFYLLSLVPLFHDSCFTDYFVDNLDQEIVSLILGVHGLSDELLEIVSADPKAFDDASVPENEKLSKFLKERLISIGKIWSQCDRLESLSKRGNLGLLAEYISSSIKLLQDSNEELEEWLEDPVINSDPFGMNDNFSDEEGSDLDAEDEEVSETMIEFVRSLLQKSRLLKLLLGSLTKSIDIKKDTASTAAQLSELHLLHKSIVSNSDTLISSTLMNAEYESDPEVETATLAINNDVKKIIKIVTQLNSSNESKLKWIQVWSTTWNSLNN
ncbi:unnamed protein product [Kluyveromyces dobzhanskii CBS 2104]|uniref:WGS project CCBQ000000000 data, contig MAT n=1 Tax=Kluyveromyces dobzhanskii CBS 2104 TaxID=1427455 RepID=A0A0A8L421_9SACH|nr:unnamed protein product [Kluyveromyces dobzhanskii CBS 2104]